MIIYTILWLCIVCTHCNFTHMVWWYIYVSILQCTYIIIQYIALSRIRGSNLAWNLEMCFFLGAMAIISGEDLPSRGSVGVVEFTHWLPLKCRILMTRLLWWCLMESEIKNIYILWMRHEPDFMSFLTDYQSFRVLSISLCFVRIHGWFLLHWLLHSH